MRIGHRVGRDKRVTTHTALTARAFGASYFFLADVCDESVIKSIFKVEERWGMGFKLFSCGLDYKEYIDLWKKSGGIVVHLTMYGLNIEDRINEIRKNRKNILIAIGAEKVPRELYELSDYNIAIGNQPHSEVAALAVFLDRLYNGEELYIKYKNPKVVIIPSERGKKVLVKNKERESDEEKIDDFAGKR